MYLRDDAQVTTVDGWAVLRRGKLAEVGEWSHQYGNVANTGTGLVAGGSGVLVGGGAGTVESPKGPGLMGSAPVSRRHHAGWDVVVVG